ARPHRGDRCPVQLHGARRTRRLRRGPARGGTVGMSAPLSGAPERPEEAPPPPLRRDPAHGYLAGVCAGFAARLGIDPLLIRIGFVLTLAAGGAGIPLYVIGWALIPAEGPERPVVARLLNRRDTWLVAAGIGCLTLSAVLLLRNWGLWFG